MFAVNEIPDRYAEIVVSRGEVIRSVKRVYHKYMLSGVARFSSPMKPISLSSIPWLRTIQFDVV
jgi:hypothetical protein